MREPPSIPRSSQDARRTLVSRYFLCWIFEFLLAVSGNLGNRLSPIRAPRACGQVTRHAESADASRSEDRAQRATPSGPVRASVGFTPEAAVRGPPGPSSAESSPAPCPVARGVEASGGRRRPTARERAVAGERMPLSGSDTSSNAPARPRPAPGIPCRSARPGSGTGGGTGSRGAA